MRNSVAISAAFFFVFFGFATAQQYMVVLYAEDGRGSVALVSLLLLYSVFLVTGLFASKLIYIVGGLKRSFAISIGTYAFFVGCIALNNIPLLFLGSMVVGIGATLLWVASGQIIGDSSKQRDVGVHFAYQMIGQGAGFIAGMYAGAYLFDALPK